MANSVYPDEMPHSAASHLGLYCLPRPVCPNIYGKYGIKFCLIIFINFECLLNSVFYDFALCERGTRCKSFGIMK